MARIPAHVEIERTYDVSGDLLPPDLVGVGAIATAREPVVTELLATYYDTPELTLARAHVALRARRGGKDEGWHVKLAPLAEGRPELHWPLGDGESIPPEILEAVAEHLGGSPVSAVARIANTRTTTVLQDPAGFDLAELCDDRVRSTNLLTGGTGAWREWEVELLSGAPDTRTARTTLLDGIEKRLFAAGARPSASGSKLGRTLRLA